MYYPYLLYTTFVIQFHFCMNHLCTLCKSNYPLINQVYTNYFSHYYYNKTLFYHCKIKPVQTV